MRPTFRNILLKLLHQSKSDKPFEPHYPLICPTPVKEIINNNLIAFDQQVKHSLDTFVTNQATRLLSRAAIGTLIRLDHPTQTACFCYWVREFNQNSLSATNPAWAMAEEFNMSQAAVQVGNKRLIDCGILRKIPMPMGFVVDYGTTYTFGDAFLLSGFSHEMP